MSEQAKPENILYYGDNLDIMRRYIADESVDLVYADPPFNSNASYNVLFAEKDGSQAASQIRAFDDTWTWGEDDLAALNDLVTAGAPTIAKVIKAFWEFVGPCDMLSYIVMMAPRLIACRRVLKPTGSMYLHCDPSASHYLKLLMDGVFGPENFSNEIVWKRTTSKSLMTRRLPTNHDILLVYQKGEDAFWNADAMFQMYDPDNLDAKTAKKYCHQEPDGRRYTLGDLTNPNANRPNLTYEFLGHHKVWRWTKERMEKAFKDGVVIQPSPGAVPRYKRYLEDMRGKPIDDVWVDIAPLNSQATERLGYPTQKPEALLERIIKSSCPEGGTVLDPFCGCGTTITVAQKLNRPWIGIDITHLSITLMRERMKDTFGEQAKFKVLGEPTSVPDAEALAASDPYQFQWWALGLVGARPVEEKKGADKGIDGKIVFQGDQPGKFESVIISVKAGKTQASHVRDLKGVLDREKAAIGVLISMQEPTKPMKDEAATAGHYTSDTWGKRYPRIQLLTVAELLEGWQIEMPPIKQVQASFRKAPKAKPDQGEQQELKV